MWEVCHIRRHGIVVNKFYIYNIFQPFTIPVSKHPRPTPSIPRTKFTQLVYVYIFTTMPCLRCLQRNSWGKSVTSDGGPRRTKSPSPYIYLLVLVPSRPFVKHKQHTRNTLKNEYFHTNFVATLAEISSPASASATTSRRRSRRSAIT
jgi:hypothetical protein